MVWVEYRVGWWCCLWLVLFAIVVVFVIVVVVVGMVCCDLVSILFILGLVLFYLYYILV